MKRRFWLAVARFAAHRAGDYIVKVWRETTPEEYDAYAAACAQSVVWTQPASTISTTLRGANVTWRYQ